MTNPRTEVFDRSVEPGELDVRLEPPAIAVVTAPPPLRAALAAVCIERETPCLIAVPVDPDPRAWLPLLRAPRRVLALVPLLAGRGVARALQLAALGSLGTVRGVTVRATGGASDATAVHQIVCLGLAALPGARSATVLRSRRDGEGLSCEFRGDGGAIARVQIAMDTPGGDLEVEIDGARMAATVIVRAGRETLTLHRGAERREVPLLDVTPGARLMAALLAEATPPAWLEIAHALHAWTLCGELPGVRTDLPVHAPDAGENVAWQQAVTAAREALTPREALLAAGLVPDVTVPDDAPDAPADHDALDLGNLEALAFEAGLKPALYLTVPRERAGEIRARYASYHVASVWYDLARDALSDARARVNTPEGEGTHVDLFVCRDEASAQRAREIYRDPRGPSVRLAEMGALLGYPACCVAAFASLPDRSNNSANRHACRARTTALGFAFAPELNNLFAHLVPFFPCSYACPRGVAHARAVLDAFAVRNPGPATALRAALTRPVFYADHARALALEGAVRDGARVRYAGVRAVASGGMPMDEARAATRFRAGLASVLARGDGLRELDNGWEVLHGDRVVATLTRRAPALVELFPFGI